MTDGTPVTGAGTVQVPDDVHAKFGTLVDLILRSESMNDGERQYWINILPVMTPEQLQSLQDILENEKRQLEAIDKKYAGAMEQMGQQKALEELSREREAKAKERASVEETAKSEEEKAADALLNQIEDAGA